MKYRWLLLIPLLTLLSACVAISRPGGYYEDDGPDARPPVDIVGIPDAVPKTEPRAASGNNPYAVYGRTYTPLADAAGYREQGTASWYGKKFHGKRTSSGEPYDMYAMTAAHKTLPLPTYLHVRNLDNGRSVVVRVNDRGPFLHDRLIDLSYAAAAKLGILGNGTGRVEIEAIAPDDTATQTAKVKIYPLQLVSPAMAAEEIPVAAPEPATKLYLQVGAFTQHDNALSLRDRLEREALRPISIQTTGADAARVYRVRIGPLASAEEGDRLAERVAQLGIAGARVVAE